MPETVAKALQCPDCGHRHPIDDFAAYRTFRCQECRRLLKVPKSAERPPPKQDATEQLPEADAARKKIPPSQRGDAISEQRRAGRAPAASGPAVPRGIRALIWVVAIPAGLIPVLLVGRLIGVLTVDRAIDLFIGVGFGRFVVPLLVLPLWAALSATLAHLAIEGVARARAQGRPAAESRGGS